MYGIKLKSVPHNNDNNEMSPHTQDSEGNILAERAKKGDPQAFELIVQKYERLLYSIAYQKTGSREDAADITQEIFIKVWHSLNSFRGESSFATWICRIAINACVDYIRKNRRSHSVSLTEFDENGESDGSEIDIQDNDTDVNPEARTEKNENIAEIRAAIAALTDEQRIVIMLRDIQGFSYTEIAEITGLELGTVKSRINRARLSIKNFITKNENI